ncbi:MAG TPA: ATP-binding protein [Streptosporangiaceae bacterium]|nr:ATP-binding protein [Streptosporangiaceae bacterium]
MTGTSPITDRLRERAARRWPLSRIIGVALLILLLFSVAAMVAGGLSLLSLHDNRERVVGTIDPAALQVQRLDTALVNQETGVRGYALSAQQDFLQPYRDGVAQEASAIKALRAVVKELPAAAATDLNSVATQARLWRAHYALPTISRISQTGKPVTGADTVTGKAEFDALRGKISTLQGDISGARDHAVAELSNSAAVLDGVFIAVAAGLAAIVVLLAVGLRATAIRPLHRLAAEARLVADGNFEHRVTLNGPREVTDLAADVNRMRERILQALAESRQANALLQEHTEELERSNAELEQFAYVASHDLQEPLRKVASFTQLLQRRYAGQLDARADQYIEFAVDGARRMQALINDLLQYSRVGRTNREPALISSDAALNQARSNVAAMIEETGATVETGHLPLVLAELTLLTAVFQNLLSNALKFRGDKPPRIVITCTKDDPFWQFAFTDNGIGIEPEYAERIFVIFQRLHERSAYPGTGIGLAMTRKIIEYFGGRIWLDTAYTEGSRFLFTLPMPAEAMDEDLEDIKPGSSGTLTEEAAEALLREHEEADD